MSEAVTPWQLAVRWVRGERLCELPPGQGARAIPRAWHGLAAGSQTARSLTASAPWPCFLDGESRGVTQVMREGVKRALLAL